MINLSFHGAARTVTGSRHLLDINGYRLLLDCGLFQGRRSETYQRNLHFSFDPRSVNSVIISHAHMDHLGNLPNLVKQGFDGDVNCTSATLDLANIMLTDSASIQESDIRYVNKVRRRHNQPPAEPLYDTTDVPPTLRLLRGNSYEHRFDLARGISVIFHDAGHILGSAITVINIDDGDRKLSVCFTGDLGRKDMPIIRDPYVVADAEVLIIESTYGNRLHSEINQVMDKLASVINETVARGGKIIVPSFALERTQELIYCLHQLKLGGRIPSFPIYIDSPLAIDATDIFRVHPECYDADTAQLLRTVADPFGFRGLHYVSSVEESKHLNLIKTPMMIIAGSGMAEAGRITHHLKNNIGKPNNTVLIVGWQAENTLGRKIAERWPEVTIFGEKHKLRCRVEIFNEFSAHADRNDLIRWIGAGRERWQKVFVVHGEEQSALSLADAFKEIGLHDVEVPEEGQTFQL
ncbi:MAG: MBL fold metallo-hydrolase [Dehalococcoidia bacterium]|nr:MBL fold metallo-hydrolase [Dehalococcoidia bacterium]